MSAGSPIWRRGACASSAIRISALPRTTCGILRFFRFHAAYAPAIIPTRTGLAACIAGRDGLDQLSRERVRMEMMKLVVAPHAVPTLIAMTDAGLALRMLGGVELSRLVRKTWRRWKWAIGQGADPVRRLGALGRDGGRGCRAPLAEAAADQQRARASGVDGGGLAAHIAELRRAGFAPRCSIAWARSPFTDHALLGWARSDASASDGRMAAAGANLPQRFSAPVFPLKAADFIKRGVGEGPALGAAMRAAEAAWIAAGFPNDAAALAAIADAAANPHLRDERRENRLAPVPPAGALGEAAERSDGI